MNPGSRLAAGAAMRRYPAGRARAHDSGEPTATIRPPAHATAPGRGVRGAAASIVSSRASISSGGPASSGTWSGRSRGGSGIPRA